MIVLSLIVKVTLTGFSLSCPYASPVYVLAVEHPTSDKAIVALANNAVNFFIFPPCYELSLISHIIVTLWVL